MADWTIETIRDHFERLFELHDRLNTQRFESADKAVSAAFLASEKAIIKAEDAQRDYNVRSNEFRGQLDDQAKLFIARSEVAGMFKSLDDKIAVMQKATDQKFDEARLALEKMTAFYANEIAVLRESKSQLEGTKTGIKDMMGWILAAVAIGGFIVKIVFP